MTSPCSVILYSLILSNTHPATFTEVFIAYYSVPETALNLGSNAQLKHYK